MKKCKIKSVKKIGKRKTYNITMKSDQHNYAVFDSDKDNCFVISKNSHACAYGYTSFQTAYLKANYTEEFFCSLLNSINTRKDFDKMEIVLGDLENFDISLKENDINLCDVGYNIVKKRDLSNGVNKSEIAPSLMCKGVGSSPAQEIADNRPYEELRDIAIKTNGKIVSTEVIGNLFENNYLDSVIDKRQKRLDRKELTDEFVDMRNSIKKARKKGIDPSEGIF